MLGQEHCFLRRAADADAENSRRAPASAHLWQSLQNPVDDRIVGIEHDELGFCFRASALGGNGDLDRSAAHDFDKDRGRRVVLGVDALAGGIGLEAGAELVVGIEVGAADAGVDHFLQIERLLAGPRRKTHVHAQLDEGVHDARVLADGAMALGAHAAVDEDLRYGVARGGRLLALVGLRERADVIHRMVVADVLQRGCNARDEIFLADDGHGGSLHSLDTLFAFPTRK